MILVDVNLLIYAYSSFFAQHERAHVWLEEQLNGGARVGFPWPSLLGFMRIVTQPRGFPRPEPTDSAWRQVLAWLDAPRAWIPQPGDRHAEILGSLLATPGVRGDLVPDAHLAALAIEHELTLCSADGGFARFPGLRWTNPLAI